MQTLLKDVGECLKAMGLLEFYEYLVMVFWVFVFFGVVVVVVGFLGFFYMLFVIPSGKVCWKYAFSASTLVHIPIIVADCLSNLFLNKKIKYFPRVG